jgi:hypothetical protein
MAAQQQVQIMSIEMRKASSYRSEDMADLELALARAAPPAVQRQDSLYRDASRVAREPSIWENIEGTSERGLWITVFKGDLKRFREVGKLHYSQRLRQEWRMVQSRWIGSLRWQKERWSEERLQGGLGGEE